MKKRLISIGAVVLGIAMGAFGAIRWSTRGATKFDTPYQAVLLDNGQAYYGRIDGLGTAFPVLKEVYYVEHGVNPQTKEVSNILVRRGSEWHAPDSMVLNASHIVFVEPVATSSKVAELIRQAK